MTNGEKIVVGILAILLIIVIIHIIPINTNIKNSVDNDMETLNVFDHINNDENDINQNNIEEQDSKDNENEVNNQTVVGKEEQESKQENVQVNMEEKAIEMAKEEWGISIDSYNFEANNLGEGIYDVSVISKTSRTVITIYNVNVVTGSIKEKN